MDIIFDAIMAFSDVIKNWHERLVPCTSQIRRAAEMPLEVKNWFLENSKTLLGQINPKYIEKSELILVLVRRGKNDRFHVHVSCLNKGRKLAACETPVPHETEVPAEFRHPLFQQKVLYKIESKELNP
ncbi:MAG: hypothetical protein K6C40_08565 [Thermoguttaceae bacterium]|nr:hypothetical protein [Thermoguttaceae bacterium]